MAYRGLVASAGCNNPTQCDCLPRREGGENSFEKFYYKT